MGKKTVGEKVRVRKYENRQRRTVTMLKSDLTAKMWPVTPVSVWSTRGIIYLVQVVTEKWLPVLPERLPAESNMTPEDLAGALDFTDCVKYNVVPSSWPAKTKAIFMIGLLGILLFALFLLASAVFE